MSFQAVQPKAPNPEFLRHRAVLPGGVLGVSSSGRRLDGSSALLLFQRLGLVGGGACSSLMCKNCCALPSAEPATEGGSSGTSPFRSAFRPKLLGTLTPTEAPPEAGRAAGGVPLSPADVQLQFSEALQAENGAHTPHLTSTSRRQLLRPAGTDSRA